MNFIPKYITQIVYHSCNIRCTQLRRRKYAVSAIDVILAPECLHNRHFDIYMLERVQYLICQKHMAYKCKKGRRRYKKTSLRWNKKLRLDVYTSEVFQTRNFEVSFRHHVRYILIWKVATNDHHI